MKFMKCFILMANYNLQFRSAENSGFGTIYIPVIQTNNDKDDHGILLTVLLLANRNNCCNCCAC